MKKENIHIFLRACVFAFALSSWCSVYADAFKAGHPEEYVVKKGDTLWGISETFLTESWKWPEIWYNNPQVENPHLIYPGDRLRSITVNGKKVLMVMERGNSTGSSSRKTMSDGSIKLSPKARVTPIELSIPAIPLDAIQSYLVNHRVLDSKEELERAPYIISGYDGHLVMGKNDKLYARGKFTPNVSAYGIYRQGDPYVDPDTGEVLGLEARDLGLVKIIEMESDVATLALLSTNQDVRLDDRLLPTVERKVEAIFYPQAPRVDIGGRIIHVFGGVRNVSQFNVVVLNKGNRNHLRVGDVLAVYRKTGQVRDQQTNELIELPADRSGLLIVFRTFEKVSFGLILKAERNLMVLDEVRNP